jgi:hypothetical protein
MQSLRNKKTKAGGVATEPAAAPVISEAVGSGSQVVARDPSRAKRIEAAMASAIRDALAEGIALTDTDTIRARMLAARDSVKTGA